jgi:hypothetical protein
VDAIKDTGVADEEVRFLMLICFFFFVFQTSSKFMLETVVLFSDLITDNEFVARAILVQGGYLSFTLSRKMCH